MSRCTADNQKLSVQLLLGVSYLKKKQKLGVGLGGIKQPITLNNIAKLMMRQHKSRKETKRTLLQLRETKWIQTMGC